MVNVHVSLIVTELSYVRLITFVRERKTVYTSYHTLQTARFPDSFLSIFLQFLQLNADVVP